MHRLVTLTRGRWKVAAQTTALVLAVLVVRVLVDALSAEFVTPGPLTTSIVAGGIFVIGLIVAGTLADYKESERMPSDIAAALDNLHEDARCLKAAHKPFDLARFEDRLGEVVRTLKLDLMSGESRDCLDAVNALSESIVELERLDVPPNYIVRLRTEQGNIRRSVLRTYHIQRTEFLPSAYILIQSIVVLILALLAFAKVEPGYEAVALLLVISYFFIYLVKLLKILDTPFQVGQHTMDDVSLFLLNEFVANVGAAKPIPPPAA